MATLTVPLRTVAGPPPSPVAHDLAGEEAWRTVLATAVARALCTVYCCLLAWSVLPLAVGASSQLVMSGSMAPALATGDVVVTRDADPTDLVPGRIVTVADPDRAGRLRTHRIDVVRADGALVLRGDNNAAADSSPVARADVRGVVVLLVPWVGLPQVWWHEHRWVPLGGFVVVAGLAVGRLRRRGPGTGPGTGPGPGPGHGPTLGARDELPRRTPPPPAPPRPPAPPPPTWARRASTVIAMGALVTLVVAGTASAAFRVTTSNAGSTLSAAADFNPYRTAVLADSPLFFWQVRETGGTTVVNAAPTGVAATYRGGIVLGQTGAIRSEPVNTSITLSSGSLTADASTTAPGTFSVEAWVRTTGTAGGRVLGFGNQGGATGSSQLDRQLYVGTDGKAYFGAGSGLLRGTVASPTALNDGAWHHLVGTYGGGLGGLGGTVRLYVDGSLVGSATASPSLTGGFWRAGFENAMTGWPNAPVAAGANYLVGSLDELAVYPSALSAARVSAHFSAAQG